MRASAAFYAVTGAAVVALAVTPSASAGIQQQAVTAASLLQSSGDSPSAVPATTGPVPLTSGTARSAAAPDIPGAYSPSGCILNTGNYPHLAASARYGDAKVFETTRCKRNVPVLYISVALYKTDFLGYYFESSGSNRNYNKDNVGAGASKTCSNRTQDTTFFGIAYSYSLEDGKTYSAEGSSPSKTLKCGTPGGAG